MFRFLLPSKKDKDEKIVDTAPKTHADYINAKSKRGKTALHKAIDYDNYSAMIDIILKTKNVELDVRDDLERTPLQLAVKKKTADYTRALIMRGADLNVLNKNGENLLHEAIMSNSFNNVKLLLEKNILLEKNNSLVNPTKSSKSYSNVDSPLHYCFRYESAAVNPEIVIALVDAGANVNSKNKLQNTPLHLALKRYPNCEPFIDKLLTNFDTTNVSENTTSVLHEAANYKVNTLVFKRVLDKVVSQQTENGKNILDKLDEFETSALFYAIGANNTEKAELLLNVNANPNVDKNHIPLIVAIHHDNNDIAKRLIAAGAAIDAKDFYHNTPLISAAERGNNEIIECLKNRGLNFSNEDAKIAVKRALLNGHVDTVIKLIECGANPNVHIYPSTQKKASFSTTSFVSKSIISDFCDNNDGPDKTGYLNAGDTPLHFAVATENKKLAEACLFTSPGMVNVPNKKHNTPANIAIKMVSKEMANLLYEMGDQIQPAQTYDNETRAKTLYMTGIHYGLESQEQTDEFFADPNTPLTEVQKIKRQEVEKKYQDPRYVKNINLVFKSKEVSKSETTASNTEISEDFYNRASTKKS